MQFGKRVRALIKQGSRLIGQLGQRAICALFNLRRRLFRKRLAAYVVFTLENEISEREPQIPWWYQYIPGRKEPLSLEMLAKALRQVAGDPAVKGVVFLVKHPALSLAQAQSISALLMRFREWDIEYNADAPRKEIIFHLEQCNTAIYTAACAADQILITPLTSWDVLGLRTTPLFLKDALARLGIEMDVVQIAPWKSALDTFTRTDISPEQAEQLQWLLESWYTDIIQAIAHGRQLTPDVVKALIDDAPWDAQQALARQLVDGIAYEDELPTRLGTTEKVASLQLYAKLRRLLFRRPHMTVSQRIGVLSLQGSIMPGESQRQPFELPILGRQTLGSITAQQQIRAARADETVAAVVVYIDSPGGSALASDLIWRELRLLQQKKPVVVYMGDVAASGGYYIAMGAQQIVAQRATLTGSIGVITGKAITEAALAKVGAHRAEIQRGAHAGIYADDHHWAASERAKVEESVHYIYEVFKTRVAEGRGLPYATLDAVANGRVWTGVQAVAHGLVDELGDFACAVEKACALADLPTDGRVAVQTIITPKPTLLATAATAAQTLVTGVLSRHSPDPSAALFQIIQWQTHLERERYWLIVDGLPRLHR
jgi:protease-4